LLEVDLQEVIIIDLEEVVMAAQEEDVITIETMIMEREEEVSEIEKEVTETEVAQKSASIVTDLDILQETALNVTIL
jgi:methionine aminopeptidase